jgi:hypothetical protein
MEPGSVRPELLGETLALVYAGLVARAGGWAERQEPSEA